MSQKLDGLLYDASQVKSSQVAFNKKAMTIALRVHNVQTIHNVHIVNCAN